MYGMYQIDGEMVYFTNLKKNIYGQNVTEAFLLEVLRGLTKHI